MRAAHLSLARLNTPSEVESLHLVCMALPERSEACIMVPGKTFASAVPRAQIGDVSSQLLAPAACLPLGAMLQIHAHMHAPWVLIPWEL